MSHPVIQSALKKNETSGLLIVEDQIYHVTGIPVLFRNRVFGAVVVGFRIDDQETALLDTITKSEASFIFDHQLIASAWSGDRRQKLASELKKRPTDASGKSEKDPEGKGFEWVVDDQDYIATRIPLGDGKGGGAEGYYLLQLSKDEATEFIDTIQRTILLPGVIFGLVTALISFFLLQEILVPLGKLMRASEAIAAGDLHVEPIQVSKRNEVGVLVQSFSAMVERLCEANDQKLQYEATLAKTAESVVATSESLTSSSERMSDNSIKVSRQANSLSTVSKENNHNIQTITVASEEILSTTDEIGQSVQKATEITMKAVEMAESANEIMLKLERSGEEIGKVTKFITSVAEQTNLLALNATIEAARAGQSGKSFAVVAGEVKGLAKETAKATDDIRQRISAIQSDAMSSVTEVSEIRKIIAQINEIATTISMAIGEQTKRIAQVSRNISKVAEGSSGAVESIDQVMRASKSTEDEGTNVLSASKRLAKMGEDLIDIVGKLKIDIKHSA